MTRRFSVRIASLAGPDVGGVETLEQAVLGQWTELVFEVQQDVVHLRVGERVELQHSALRPQVEVDEPDPQRLAVPRRR